MWKKYWQIAKASWDSGFTYRLNFIMWRVRMLIQLLAVYFLWAFIAQRNQTPFGYEQTILVTYILFSAIVRSLVFSSRSIDAQTEIATGELSNYLLKPINYFSFWFSRDVADKILNVIFSLIEVALVWLVLRPQVFIQTNLSLWLATISAIGLAIIMYFFFSFIISLTTFWYSEANGWPQRFLVFTLLEFMAGSLFPLDILPAPVYRVLSVLPPTLFVFTPTQIYLGRFSVAQIITALLMMVGWIMLLWGVGKFMWIKGTRHYEAWGR